MGGLASLVKNGVATADRLTTSLQVSVIHKAWAGNDGLGGASYTSEVSRLAIVERKQKLFRSNTGEEIISQHVINFLRPISNYGIEGRSEPIDQRDVFILPDGTTGPVVGIEGLFNPETGASYYHSVYLGARR